MTDDLYDKSIGLPSAGGLCWFCPKCERSMFKTADKTDLALNSVLHLLAKATEKITQLETVVSEFRESTNVFQGTFSKKIESMDKANSNPITE